MVTRKGDCLYLPLPPLHPTHADTQTCVIYTFLCIIFLYLYCTLLCCILVYFNLIYIVLFMLRKKNTEAKKFRNERTLNLSCGETAQADRTVETMRKVKAWCSVRMAPPTPNDPTTVKGAVQTGNNRHRRATASFTCMCPKR